MADDREILKELWESKIPVNFTLPIEEVESGEEPDSICVSIYTEILVGYNVEESQPKQKSWVPLVRPLLFFCKNWWVPNTNSESRTQLDDLQVSLLWKESNKNVLYLIELFWLKELHSFWWVTWRNKIHIV